MLSNRDDKRNEHEESEYHFSDDDVGYEIETDSPKSSGSEGGGAASNPLSSLSGSKRMMISLGVFLVLIFVVYKMVAPGTSVPSTEIAPQTAAPAENMSASSAPTSAPAATEQAAPAQAPTQPVMSVATESQQPSAMSPAPAVSQEMTSSPTPPPPMQQAQQPGPQQQVQAQQASTVEQKPAEQNPEVVVSMPPVIPVQSNVPSSPVQSQVVTSVSHPGTEAAIASMVSTNEKLMGQLQADYTQRLNEYSNQTKDIQGQIQALNSRVVTMESQMNQIVQILTHGAPQTTSPSMAAPSPAAPPPQVGAQSQGSDVKVNYSVQAIIPGRAWLKSENGETVTVAEGDTIKDLGRVTKIDPYDGVVEVNTGTKTVSISYGNSE